MGLTNAISQKELQDLHQQIKKLQQEKIDIERDLNMKDGNSKSLLNKLRDEKTSLEKKLFETEFLAGEREKTITQMQD